MEHEPFRVLLRAFRQTKDALVGLGAEDIVDTPGGPELFHSWEVYTLTSSGASLEMPLCPRDLWGVLLRDVLFRRGQRRHELKLGLGRGGLAVQLGAQGARQEAPESRAGLKAHAA